MHERRLQEGAEPMKMKNKKKQRQKVGDAVGQPLSEMAH